MTAASESGYPSRMSTGSCRERHSDLASAKGAVLFNLSWSFRAMERIRFISHQGKQILFVDFSNCSADEVQTIARTVPDYVTTKPRGSVLILTDFAGASFDRDALLAMKESAVFDKPFVKKSALIGTESLPRDFYEAMKTFSRRELPTFETREEALAWLVRE